MESVLQPGSTLHGFTIAKREALPEIDGEAIQGVHIASGARLLFLKNDDNNKSFAIGFRTPPKDDTGVFHILEHSVLCGSQRFPVKEPFVDLLKGSMQTFLNAMTFGDKTLYPVASTNEQDLFNLMDVYLDAVFHPNIYGKRAIFEQEGWHYELSDEGLVCNGVVFNEMKGALSDASSVLYDKLQEGLFPHNCYAFESGGTPAAISTVTYEDYLDEHRRHYRTDNSYIILYGNLDADRALAFLDERYLAPVAAEQCDRDEARAQAGLEPLVPRSIELHDPVRGRARVPMKTAPENACAGEAYVIGSSHDRVRVMAADILLDALLGSNEAPLKRALLDLGVAHDVHAFVSEAVLQPFAVVEMQMPAPEGDLTRADIIKREVGKLLDAGLDHELVEAALSHEEFQMREHDFGVADGVVLAMSALSGWLYDDGAATDYLRYEDAFAELRAQMDNGYFEDLARALFIDNDHVASVEVVPDENASDGGLSARLASVEEGLDEQDRERIRREVALLRELQEAPDAPEAIATLPRLSVDDIGPAPEEPTFGPVEGASVTCIRHEVPTRGIVYTYRYFDMRGLAFDELPYASLLANVLGKLGTARHTAAQIDTLVQGKLGNLTFFTDVSESCDDPDRALPLFAVSASALSENAEWAATLPREVMLESDFSDAGKILDVLKQRKIGMEQSFANAGHSCASARLKSYYDRAGVIREQLGNVGFYGFLCDLIEHYDERAAELAAKLADVASRLFRDDACTMSFAGSDGDYERFWQAGAACGNAGIGGEGRLVVPEPVVRNEAFVVPTDICYAAVGWDRRQLGEPHSGAWLVAARALSYDYLWNEVRVKGGAYGVGFQALRTGNLRFYSYRDPHLDETLERFSESCGWLARFEPSREDLDGFIVATVAKIDAPVKAREVVRRQMGDHFSGRTTADRRRVRQQVVEASAQDVQALAPVLGEAIGKGAVCVFGNRGILEGAKADLELVSLVG